MLDKVDVADTLETLDMDVDVTQVVIVVAEEILQIMVSLVD